MTDVRCPMCGKDNPASLDVCQYCQARLRPIWNEDAREPVEKSPDTELPEWLQSLGSAAEETVESSEPVPDWLAGLRDRAANDPNLSEPSGTAGADSTEWLNTFLAEDGIDAGRPKDDLRDDRIDWLSRIGSSNQSEPEKEPPVSLTEPAQEDSEKWDLSVDDGLPDWLKPIGMSRTQDGILPDEQVESDADLNAETPDWFRVEAENVPERIDDSGLPAWLTGVESDDMQPAPSELPDWLHPTAPAEEHDQIDDLSSWLSTLGPADAGAPQPTDALYSQSSDEMVEAGPIEPAEAISLEDELSGALPPAASGTGMLGYIMDNEARPLEPTGVEPIDTSQSGDTGSVDQDMAAWLATLEGESITPASSDLLEAESSAENDLSWLDELESTYSDLALASEQPDDASGGLSIESAAVDAAELESSELPAWLTGEPRKDEPAENALAEDPSKLAQEMPNGEDGLGMAELPSWLQAMRPVAAMPASSSGEDEGDVAQAVEAAGPLSGLRGVLPAELDILQAEKPPVYANRIEVSEAQEKQARMLSELLEAETRQPEVGSISLLPSAGIWRLVVAALMILALLASILTGLPRLGTPSTAPEASAAVAARQLMTGLPPGTPVLFAVDYDPGFSAEMDAVAETVLTYLLSRGVLPVFVSTTPTGPMQAERLLQRIGIAHHRDLIPVQEYVNLGFLPGGATGLAAFIQSPQDMLRYEVSSGAFQPAWESPALQGVDTLNGFRMILVATESPERARAWIEQMENQPAARPPLVMAVSSQADPLVRPYYTTQVQGLVSGLTGALAFEEGVAQAGTVREYWPAFNTGLMAAAVLMLSSIAINLIGRVAGRKKPPVERTA